MDKSVSPNTSSSSTALPNRSKDLRTALSEKDKLNHFKVKEATHRQANASGILESKAHNNEYQEPLTMVSDSTSGENNSSDTTRDRKRYHRVPSYKKISSPPLGARKVSRKLPNFRGLSQSTSTSSVAPQTVSAKNVGRISGPLNKAATNRLPYRVVRHNLDSTAGDTSAGLGSTLSSHRNYGSARHSVATGQPENELPSQRYHQRSGRNSPHPFVQNFPGPPEFFGATSSKYGFPRRRAYSEINRPVETGFNDALSEFYDSDESDEDIDSSVYISSNPSSRGGSDASSIDDVCFPVESIDDTGNKKTWPDIEVLNEFAQEEVQRVSKMQKAASEISPNSSVKDNNSGVNFEYPIVSNIEQGEDASMEPLIRSKEEETRLINGRLRPPRITPWDRERHDSFRAKESMLGKFRFTYFREDMPETIHSKNISGLIHKEGLTFEELFSPSYYRTKLRDASGGSTSPEPQNSSKLSHVTTASTTPTSSVADYTQMERQYIPPFWLDVCNPSEDEMKTLSKSFGIHPLTNEDIFLGEAREKVELFKDYYFVCFTSFDVAQEHHRQKVKEKARALSVLDDADEIRSKNENWLTRLRDLLHLTHGRRHASNDHGSLRSSSKSLRRSIKSTSSRKHLSRKDELVSLNMYVVVFRHGVITFHFKPSPHPGNVRRRARLLKDYLTMTSDWIGYALIDDITDAFAPLIDSIEVEVNSIEDEILNMQSGDHSDSDDSSDESDDEDRVWVRLKRRSSTIGVENQSLRSLPRTHSSACSLSSSSSSSSSSTKIISWKRKGDMLRRIGECRKRVMSLIRLLGSKPDVIKGFAKRCNEQWEMAPKSEIGLYLGDIQDHVVTMLQSLNHYEKVLARSHSNYLAQINIDMTKVNNDMNDILGKITILGSIVLPLNVVTGLWGMNCLVPGQDIENLNWFYGILCGMLIFSFLSYIFVKKVSGIV